MAEVVLENVDKVYPGGVRAVSQLSLQVADGELVVLLGPSGCGKSTTLRMIAGLEAVTSGRISIAGRTVHGVRPKDRNVAMVFQNRALYPQMSVYRNMAFGLKLRKVPNNEIDARVRRAAEILELGELLDRRPGTLSGGEQQRVALGRAIVRCPAVFLFDEPLANLDAQLRVQMRLEIGRLQGRLGTTMFYVTHDQLEATSIGRRIAVIDEGTVQQVGDPATLYDSPANRFVAGFIGTPSMNFFSGRIGRTDRGLVFEAEDGFVLPISPARVAAMEAYYDRPVTMGLRPEEIGSPDAERAEGAPRLVGRVEMVEPMGPDSCVHLRVGRTPVVIRVDSRRSLCPGQAASPAVLPDRAHFFDPQTGKGLV